jgi:hypothetical protein
MDHFVYGIKHMLACTACVPAPILVNSGRRVGSAHYFTLRAKT